MARIAVIGAGISGLGAAWAMRRAHDVVLYEAEGRLGGHANTVEVDDDGRPVPVDTGFIVYNERNYPNLVRLFDTLGVPTHESEMSFSVSARGGAFEYRSRARGFLAQPANALRIDTWRMLRDFRRFCLDAPRLVASGSRESLGGYLRRSGYGEAFRSDLLLPISAAIWSASLDGVEDFPAANLVGFLLNHDILQLGSRPRWRTVTGGSREYVRRLSEDLGGASRTSRPVAAVRRSEDAVTVLDAAGGRERFDAVVFGTHTDDALRMLGPDATAAEREVLGAIRYQRNEAVLHRDPSLMPVRRGAWASWNYLADGATDDRSRPVCLTYWMNRLQGLRTRRPVFVTLNPLRDPEGEVQRFSYAHPQLDRAAVAAQARLGAIQGVRRTWFAGAWTAHGFHEDGLRSGLAVAAALGAPAPWMVDRDAEHVGAATEAAA
jgi:predicted NAD/FAD-binding protein